MAHWFIDLFILTKQHMIHNQLFITCLDMVELRPTLQSSVCIAMKTGKVFIKLWHSLVPRRSKNRRERLVHTVCACAAP